MEGMGPVEEDWLFTNECIEVLVLPISYENNLNKSYFNYKYTLKKGSKLQLGLNHNDLKQKCIKAQNLGLKN